MTTATPTAPQPLYEDDRTGLSVETLKRAFMDNLFYIQGKFPRLATQHDYYMALAYTVRDRLLQRWISTAETYTTNKSRTVCYLSAEFLMGPHLGNNLINLGIYDQVKQAITELGLDFDALLYQEEEPGLGNGGLGRLAACFLDSLATLQIPAIGYGIRYEFGIFDQEIRDGWQVEITDKWLRFGNPWEIARPEWAVDVKLGGYTEPYTDEQGNYRVRWHPHQVIKGVPYDTPILGYLVNTANTLRLWKAEAPESFDFAAFNRGDYYGAVDEKIVSENVTKVLYPNDEPIQGKRLRLMQQIFFVSCSLQDMFRILKGQGIPVTDFHKKFAIQLNDTHPAIAVAELMRLLVDEHHLDWDTAWDITTQSCAYTNHTLLPEALERWPLDMFASLLPRHLEIIYEINRRFLDLVRERFPGDLGKVQRMSLIDESGERYVRMANLATVGSKAVNGVAALHTELLKQTVLKDFYDLWPEKFQNKTNGVTPRRWLLLSNLRLSRLIASRIGKDWVTHYEQLRQLEAHVDDPQFRQEWRDCKRAIKAELVDFIRERTGVVVDPDSMFDVQIKRIHEYKRQHLQALHIVALYNRLKRNPGLEIPPRTFIFGGKAAPGYFMAKLIIKLINSIAEVVNHDPDIQGRIQVVFLPDYNVKLAQRVFPAADLSEQISTAGKEASGTGNMKFALNGAVTIGTLDGANIEIRERVGAENFFLFGLTAQEVMALRAQGYRPWEYYNSNPVLKEVIDQIASGMFSRGDTSLFRPLVDSLLNHDPYFLLADFQSFLDCQDQVSETYKDPERWTRMSILNTARTGYFSSDRTIQEYCRDIWRASPVPIELKPYDHYQAGMRLT
ncbi:MAG: glycogen/starch/alpha-glucan phosphorylase [Gloeomargarita sp. SKYBB_i_bin120]|nr:glycogen/starch/alpha-glucan phosphorylase [Gloeomargarita sp. SKYB120]MDW8179283.1 glycogen/starch/alpha-glucan phosphorylase [Gloeomargarita sp. SKYBB_i_bin120]